MQDMQAAHHSRHWALFALGACSLLGLTGCQSTFGGQSLPSPWYLRDDVQYYAPGPEFKLAREAAAQKAFQEEQESAEGPPPGGAAPAPAPPVPGPPVPVPPPAAGANLFTPRYQ